MKYGCFNRVALGLVFSALALVCLGGCESAAAPWGALSDGVIMPDLSPRVPATTLRTAWDNQVVQLPAPVTIPAAVIEAGYPAWAKAGYPGDWSIRLPDGRVAVMQAARIQSAQGLRFGVLQVSVYRPDGTLAMEQTNTELPAPSPNHPSIWSTYGTDGKTQAMSVSYLPCEDGRTIHWDVTRRGPGVTLQNLTVVDGVITYERDTDAAGRGTERFETAAR